MSRSNPSGIDNPPRDEVQSIGLKVTDIISQCNVVVATKFTRTVKMMYAVAKGIPVVSAKWVTECLESKRVLRESPLEFLPSETIEDIRAEFDR